MTGPVNKCAFCGDANSKITKEHLWPRWSHKEITRSMRKWHGLHGNYQIEIDGVSGSPRRSRHGGDIHDFQVPCVCGGSDTTCNNGWMRRLENKAKPALVPLMNGKRIRLGVSEQKLVAGWAAMKAMVSEYTPQGIVTTSQVERDRMMALQIPPERGWGIWIGHYERREWQGYLGANPFAYWPEPERQHLLGVPTTDFNGQASFQIVKKLFIQIIRCSVPDLVEKWRFDERAGRHIVKIWPPSQYSVVWPPTTMTDRDADYVAFAFQRATMTAVRNRMSREAAQAALLK